MKLRHVDRPAPSASRRGGRSDRGETLVEVLTMVILMGVGFTAIFSGMLTVSKINNLNQKRTQASNSVQAWAEGLEQPATSLSGSTTDPYTYQACGTPASYATTGRTSGSMPTSWESINPQPVSVEYFTGTFTASGEPNFTSDVSACYAYMFSAAGGSVRDRGLQRITLKVETPADTSPKIIDSLVILKRDQKCPTLNVDGSVRFDNADLGPC